MCKSTIFDIVKLKDRQTCLEMRHKTIKSNEKTSQKTQVYIGKTFVNLTVNEVLLAAAFKKPPVVTSDLPQNDVKNVAKDDVKAEVTTQILLEGCEVDVNLALANERVLNVLKGLAKKDRLA